MTGNGLYHPFLVILGMVYGICELHAMQSGLMDET